MNIFVLDSGPALCATYHNDIHLNKMIVETAQLLCNVVWFKVYKDNSPYSVLTERGCPKELKENYKKETNIYLPTHINHPASIFVRTSKQNFKWTYQLLLELLKEYEYRFDKEHKTTSIAIILEYFDTNLLDDSTLEFVIAYNKDKYANCIVDDVIQSYRNYYALKKGFSRKGEFVEYTWTKRDIPFFMNS